MKLDPGSVICIVFLGICDLLNLYLFNRPMLKYVNGHSCTEGAVEALVSAPLGAGEHRPGDLNSR